MTEQEQWDDAMKSVIAYENEIIEHNAKILEQINYDKEDFEALMDYSQITEKMEWVEKPNFKAEQNPDKFGVFTLTHVDQWTTGMEGDSFAGYMYVKVKGFKKWLKIPYSC